MQNNQPDTNLPPSILDLVQKLASKKMMMLARVFGSGVSSPSTARDLDVAFFCPYPYSSQEGIEYANSVASQVLKHGSRRSSHYGELDVFVFFPDRALVRNEECTGWSIAKNAKNIKKEASVRGRFWLDFLADHRQANNHGRFLDEALRDLVGKSEKGVLEDAHGLELAQSLIRSGASLAPWVGTDGSPCNLLSQALLSERFMFIPLLIDKGASLNPDMPDDPEGSMEIFGNAYYPTVVAIDLAIIHLENHEIDEVYDQVLGLVRTTRALVQAGADPLKMDPGGSAETTMDGYLKFVTLLQEQMEIAEGDMAPLLSETAGLMDDMLKSFPLELLERIVSDVVNGCIQSSSHELHALWKANDVMGPWIASIRQRDLEAGVSHPEPGKAPNPSRF